MGTPAAARQDDFAAWKRSVELRLRQALARSATRPQGTITSGGIDINGGSINVRGDGGISMFSAGNVEIFSAKGRTSEPEPDGDPQPEVRIYRADGTPAFYLWDPLPLQDGYQQFWSWYDRDGNLVLGDDANSGVGLARPYLSYNVGNETGKEDVTPTSTAAFATVHTIAGYIQNIKLAVPLTVTAPGTGAGEVQIVHSGTGEIVAGPTAVPTGTSIAPFYIFQLPQGLTMWSHHYFLVQTRRTSGTGNITSRVWSAHGVQS